MPKKDAVNVAVLIFLDEKLGPALQLLSASGGSTTLTCGLLPDDG